MEMGVCLALSLAATTYGSSGRSTELSRGALRFCYVSTGLACFVIQIRTADWRRNFCASETMDDTRYGCKCRCLSKPSCSVLEKFRLSVLINSCSCTEPEPSKIGETVQSSVGKGPLDSRHMLDKYILHCGADEGAIEDLMPGSPFQRNMQ